MARLEVTQLELAELWSLVLRELADENRVSFLEPIESLRDKISSAIQEVEKVSGETDEEY